MIMLSSLFLASRPLVVSGDRVPFTAPLQENNNIKRERPHEPQEGF